MSNYSEDYKIIPLSNETLNNAISLIKSVFPYKPDQKNAKWNFADSLSKPNSGENYWVAVTKNRELVGITGLYHDTYDKNIVWLGWFGVHPQHRRHGIGSKLLDFAISKSLKKGHMTKGTLVLKQLDKRRGKDLIFWICRDSRDWTLPGLCITS